MEALSEWLESQITKLKYRLYERTQPYNTYHEEVMEKARLGAFQEVLQEIKRCG